MLSLVFLIGVSMEDRRWWRPIILSYNDTAMKRRFTLVLGGIVFVQCLLLGGLGFYLYRIIKSRSNVLGSTTFNRINAEYIHQSPSETFQYYYDLPSDQVQIDAASWLPNKVRYTYNHDGLNERFDYAKVKASSVLRVVTLGDSFDFGMWVDTDKNFSELLEDALNSRLSCKNISSFQVINLGVPGYDLRYEFRRYMEKGTTYNPDIVIWFMRDENFYMNSDSYLGREQYYKRQLEASGAAERFHVNPDDQFAASGLSFKEIFDAYNALSAEEKLRYIEPEVSAVNDWRAQYDVPLVIVTTTLNEEIYKTIMKKFTQSDVRTFYLEVGDIETFHPYDYHPNIKGHQKIAESLFAFLTANNLISCNR